MSSKGKMSERLAMQGAIHKAYKVLLKLINPKYMKKDKQIPLKVIKNAKGIAFITTIKAGFVWTGSVGTGIVISRLENGEWSGPSSIGTGGMGWGAQIGASSTDSILILNTSGAVKAFSGKGQVKFGGNLSIAAGPVGRDADGSVSAGDGGVAAVYSYSHSRGAFAGISLQGSVLFARDSDNAKFYGQKISPTTILSGSIQPPENEDLRLLYKTLRVVMYSETDNYEYRDERTGSLRGIMSGDHDSSQYNGGAAYQDDSDSLGPTLIQQSPEPSPSTSYYPVAAKIDENYNSYTPTSPAYPTAAPLPSTALPDGWREVETPDGQKYYWNEKLGVTQWEKPSPAPSVAPSPPKPPVIPRRESSFSNGWGSPVNDTATASGWGGTSGSAESPYIPPTYSPAQTSAAPYRSPTPTYTAPQQQQQPAASSYQDELSRTLSSRLNVSDSRRDTSASKSPSPAYPSASSTAVPLQTAAANIGVSQSELNRAVSDRQSIQNPPPLSARPSFRAPAPLPPGVGASTSPSATAGIHTSAIPAVQSFSPPVTTSSPIPAVSSQSVAAPVANYSYEEVCGRSIVGMDVTRLEDYLTDAEFKRIFKMGREEFQQIPKWRRDKMKKEVNLF